MIEFYLENIVWRTIKIGSSRDIKKNFIYLREEVMVKKIDNKYTNSTFESIKHIDDYGAEYWFARELQKVLEYKEWRNFKLVIDKAIMSCKNSNFDVFNHFVEFNKMIELGKNAKRKIVDYKLSRYACYLMVQNADPSKEIVALGQTYFAIQTRKLV